MSLNKSEEKLSDLSRKTFLSMWSYENPFYELGKELCDVLVVFGNDIIIISDKLNHFGDHSDVKVNWKRWYKNAVSASARQLRGARNHIKNFPEKVFVDAKVSSPLPLKLPHPSLMRIHLLAVANGCDDICETTSGRKSLTVDTRCKDGEELFSVGCFGSGEDFIHIISTPALDAMFDSFDTARDFIDYLVRKREALSSEDWVIHGEENLIAAYMTSQPGNRPFFVPTSIFPLEDGARTVHDGMWAAYLDSDQRSSRIRFWKKSYLIDQLVEDIADDYAAGRMVIGFEKPISYHEGAFRLLAGESRLSRQALAGAFHDIYNESTSSFWSVVSESLDDPRVHYLWLLYPQPPEGIALEQVESRLNMELAKYMLVAQNKFRHAKSIFGICLPNRDCRLTTRLYRVIDGEKWTDEMAKQAVHFEKTEGIFAHIDQVTIGAVR
ncbi:hypothetical protein [Massilia sp. NR 4-1]|uniref:hypothetical protein n=1 Tax=Massilia sp. NR 4-1 TaxID=1678028 RepID=UPI000AFCAC6E|nr:hypothetical protein [Massilia sp. NR 4-1]